MFPHARKAIAVVDLAFGDCGKGTIVDALAGRFGQSLVVRFNGGPQAGHNVVTPDGRHHTFSQFGSGAFAPGGQTLLSRFMLIEPYALLNEAAHLRQLLKANPLHRLTIDARCPVITPAHQAANRLRELLRGPAAHGTCGLGIGQTMEDLTRRPELVFTASRLGDRSFLRRALRQLVDARRADFAASLPDLAADPRAAGSVQTLEDPAWIDAAVDNYGRLFQEAQIATEPEIRSRLREAPTLLFEGAQGVLLDERFGFHPHTTWSNTTFANADALATENGLGARPFRLGVARSYFCRHGIGPFVTEEASLSPRLPEPHNASAGWQGNFRVGLFDAVAARYAISVCGGVDAVAITHLDRAGQLPAQLCEAYADGTARIVELTPEPPGDVDRPGRLTEMLFRCKPIYRRLAAAEMRAFGDTLAESIGSRVAIASFGPTAAEKSMHGLDFGQPF